MKVYLLFFTGGGTEPFMSVHKSMDGAVAAAIENEHDEDEPPPSVFVTDHPHNPEVKYISFDYEPDYYVLETELKD